MSAKRRTGSTGKGRPTPPRPSRSGKGRTTPGTRAAAPAGRRRREPVYRQRRFPPLPWYLKAMLAAFWLTVLALSFVFVDTMTARIGIMIVATCALPLLVVLLRDPTRRTRR